MLICPVCGGRLRQNGSSYCCDKRHTYDISRSGYVNLLTANSKHSKMPGDDKLMVEARRQFLEQGYYAPLARAVGDTLLEICRGEEWQTPAILDIGCGEGYYTDFAADALKAEHVIPSIVGIDISKVALDKAAKRCKKVDFAVASAFHLPIANAGCHIAMNLFAPYCGEEILRILKPQGRLLLVIPGENHLWELKRAVYDQPYKNQVKDFALEGFSLEHHTHISENIYLRCREDIVNLFKMTPYYYKTGVENQRRLEQMDTLTVGMEFEILVYRKGDMV